MAPAERGPRGGGGGAGQRRHYLWLETETRGGGGGGGVREGEEKWRREARGGRRASAETESGTHPSRAKSRATSGMDGWMLAFWAESDGHDEERCDQQDSSRYGANALCSLLF